MSSALIVWILTGLAAVVIVLTRLRLGRSDGAGRFAVSRGLLNAHLGCGVAALLVWVPHLVAPADSFVGGELAGILAIAAWWATAACGLLLLMRWLPARGRHVTRATTDSWSQGPGLSVLAHVGMVVGVVVFTWAYLTSAA